jgi:hypothetical protein
LEVLPEKFSIMDRHTTSFRSLELLILIRAKRRLRKRRDGTRSSRLSKQCRRKLTKVNLKIKAQINKLRRARCEMIAHELERNKGNRRLFEAQRLLSRSKRREFKIKNDKPKESCSSMEASNYISV